MRPQDSSQLVVQFLSQRVYSKARAPLSWRLDLFLGLCLRDDSRALNSVWDFKENKETRSRLVRRMTFISLFKF